MRVALRDPDSDRLLASWRWLIKEGAVQYVTVLGDLILEKENAFWFLETESAKLERLATSRGELLQVMESQADRLLGTSYEMKLAQQGFVLADGQCIGFKIPTTLGGSFDLSNVYAADPYERVHFLGDINAQLKDVPDGRKVKLVIGRGTR
jgi:hypothetical protein